MKATTCDSKCQEKGSIRENTEGNFSPTPPYILWNPFGGILEAAEDRKFFAHV